MPKSVTIVRWVLWAGLPLWAGCFRETSFRLSRGEVVQLSGAAEPGPGLSGAAVSEDLRLTDTRAWLRAAHARLQHLLPPEDDPPLLTEDLRDADGAPVDVLKHFRRDPAERNTILGNFYGMLHTAQSSGADEAIDAAAPPWEGFEDVRIPVGNGIWLNARIGLARHPDGRPREADCIVILPGILGDLAVKRTRDMAFALRDFGGQHVCAIEMRGFGQTERFQPDLPYNFGVLETGDLLAVSDWLVQQPHVRRTGLAGFCWSANGALLVAWEDGRGEDDPAISPRVKPHMHRCGGRHYEAGVMAFSPTVRFEEIVEKLDEREWSGLADPALATLQKNITARKIRKGYPERSGSLHQLIVFEFARSVLGYPEGPEDGYRFLRLLPHRGKPAGPKLDSARIPVLIVHASNDILADAQHVAELLATTDNPHVAAVMLDGGGHVGFAPYAKGYFYNLLLAYFRGEPPADDPPQTVHRGRLGQ